MCGRIGARILRIARSAAGKEPKAKPMAKTRDELSEIAMAILAGLDELKSEVSFSHEGMIDAIAAAMAQMPEGDRERFRAAFDQIDVGFAYRKADGAARLRMRTCSARAGSALAVY